MLLTARILINTVDSGLCLKSSLIIDSRQASYQVPGVAIMALIVLLRLSTLVA